MKNGERDCQIPFGKKLGDDGRSLVDDPYEKHILGIVTRLRKKGRTYQQIALALMDEGYKNKIGVVRWNTTQVFD